MLVLLGVVHGAAGAQCQATESRITSEALDRRTTAIESLTRFAQRRRLSCRQIIEQQDLKECDR